MKMRTRSNIIQNTLFHGFPMEIYVSPACLQTPSKKDKSILSLFCLLHLSEMCAQLHFIFATAMMLWGLSHTSSQLTLLVLSDCAAPAKYEEILQYAFFYFRTAKLLACQLNCYWQPSATLSIGLWPYIYIYMYTHTHIYIHTYTHTHTHTHIVQLQYIYKYLGTPSRLLENHFR